jgi:hypothetical protein
MGIIYLVHLPNGKKYIGQHNTENLAKRKKGHYYGFKKFCRQIQNKEETASCCIALFRAFYKYGFHKCVWTLVETNISLDLLNAKEDDYIREYNTLSPNGCNLRFNHSDERNVYSDETLKRMSDSRRTNITELEGLPMYVIYIRRENMYGYRIQGHPNCKFKQFVSLTEPLENIKQRVLDFLKEIENAPHVSTYQVKAEAGLPKGILEIPSGYEIQVQRNGMKFYKMFTKSSISKEENLRLAIEWLSNLNVEVSKPASEADMTQFISDRAKKVIPKGITKCRN